MDSKFRSRKWFIALLTFSTVTGLLVTGFVSDAIWRDVIVLVTGAYFGTNVWEKKRGE